MVKKTTKVSRPRRVAGNCMTCAKAHLMQWGNDPIISQCAASGQREVASAPLPAACQNRYEEARVLPLEIEHFAKH
jgi:hypothetical protein